MSRPDGGPAFPLWAQYNALGELVIYDDNAGMSLRDYFAAKALVLYPFFFEAPKTNNEPAVAAAWAYKIADAMLAEREKP